MTMFFDFLEPLETIKLKLLNGKEVSIKLARWFFQKYDSTPLLDLSKTYLSKPLVKYNASYTFAELAILGEFINHGWEGCWIDSFHKKIWNAFPATSLPIQLPQEIQIKLSNLLIGKKITKIGAWDILAWKDDFLLFIESKSLYSKDKLRNSQLSFLQKALRAGFDSNHFLIVEWDFK